MYFQPRPCQIGNYVCLQVAVTQHQIRLQSENLVVLRAGERADLGFFLARLRGPHGEAGDTDNALLFTERIEHFAGFSRQANNTLRPERAHQRSSH